MDSFAILTWHLCSQHTFSCYLEEISLKEFEEEKRIRGLENLQKKGEGEREEQLDYNR